MKKISNIGFEEAELTCSECGVVGVGCDRQGGDCPGVALSDNDKIMSPIIGMSFTPLGNGRIVPIIMFDDVSLGPFICSELPLPDMKSAIDYNLFPGKLVGLEFDKLNGVVLVPKKNVPTVPHIHIKRCPSCKSSLSYKEDGLYCSNPRSCIGSSRYRLKHFFGYKGINLKGLNDKLIAVWLKKKLYMPSQVCLYLSKTKRYREQADSLEDKKCLSAQQIMYSIGIHGAKEEPDEMLLKEVESLKTLGFKSLNKLKSDR